MRAAAACIKSTAAVTSESTKVQKILDGSAEGRVKNAAERAALVTALSAFCAAPAAHNMQNFAEETADFLASYYKYGLLFTLPASWGISTAHLSAYAIFTQAQQF